MATLLTQNGLNTNDAISFSTESEGDAFLRSNPNTTQGIYQFSVDYGCDVISDQQSEIDACYASPHSVSEVRGLKYVVQYNQTTIYNAYDRIDTYSGIYLPYVHAIERAIFSTLGSGFEYDFTVSKMAHPALPRFNIIAMVGPGVIFAAIMFNLVIQAGMIVAEKELKLRESMRVMGLIDGVYWLSWIVLNVTMNILAAFLLIAAGHVFRLPMFVRNDFGTYAVLFLLFALAMVPIGLLLSTLVSKSSTATTAGFAVFLIGTLIQSFSAILYLESSGPEAAFAFSFLPFVVFGKGLSDLASATTNEYQPGIRWKARFDNDWWPLQKTYYFLIGDFFLYLIIALYIDNVFYSKRPWYFIVSPTYWRGAPKVSSNKTKQSSKNKENIKGSDYEVDDVDEDVAAEELMIRSGDIPVSKAVVLNRLSMTYSKNKYMCCGKQSFRAVKDVCVSLEDGQLFCLLGHNGAGKSTTIGMLTGLLKPTGGDATIFGHSIITSMDQIRENMGVCPQHDVLWPQLTAREHLELYAGFKRLYYKDMEEDVAQRLNDVALTAAADSPCGSYSGGMKRRLSVSIALIGDPKIVFLDEPTTGMDPVSRRQVWNLIERVKRGRVTLLTTHSMEEADTLGDRISIMKGGRFAALGPSLQLKKKFGDGYQVTVLSDPKHQEELYDHVVDFFDEKSADLVSSHDVNEMHSDGKKKEKDVGKEEAKNRDKVPKNKDSASKNNDNSSKMSKDTEIEGGANGIGSGKNANESSKDLSVKRLVQEGSVTQYEIPLEYHDHMPSFFRSLDASRKKYGIHDVQLAMASLEDVFLKVAEKGEAVEKKKVLTKEEKRAKNRKKFCWIFWSVWIALLIIGILVGAGLGFSGRSKKHTPTRLRSAEPSSFYVPPSSSVLDLATFPSAIQITDVTHDSALLSAFVTSSAATISAQLVRGDSSRNWVPDVAVGIASREVAITDSTAEILAASPTLNVNSNERVQQSVSGLMPDTVYNIWLETSENSTRRSEVTRFRTAPAIGSGLRNITFGATSAFGKTGYPYRPLNCAASQRLDAFLLLGDLVYSNSSDDLSARVAAYNTLLQSEGFHNLSRSTSFVAIWNDQEVAQGWRQASNSSSSSTSPTSEDDNQVTEQQIEDALTALKLTFPYRNGPGASGASKRQALRLQNRDFDDSEEILDLDNYDDLELGRREAQLAKLSPQWRSMSWGDSLELFVLDLQYERTEAQLMSDEQLDWLLQSLTNSKAKFKIIMSSISFTDTRGLLINVPNSWISAPEAAAQRSRVVSHITAGKIEGVLFISGGSLFGLVAHTEPTSNPKKAPKWSSWNITETAVGPIGTFVNPQVKFNPRLAFATEQFYSVVDTFNTVVYNFDPGTGYVDVKYLDEKCLVANSESFRISTSIYKDEK